MIFFKALILITKMLNNGLLVDFLFPTISRLQVFGAGLFTASDSDLNK
jgi:hypothetical protein